MADKRLLTYIIFDFLLNNYPTRSKILQLFAKVNSFVHFDYFSSQA